MSINYYGREDNNTISDRCYVHLTYTAGEDWMTTRQAGSATLYTYLCVITKHLL